MWLKISQRKGSIKDSRGRTAQYQRIKDIMFEKTCANTTFMIRSVNMICLMEVVQYFSHNSKNWKKCRFLLLTKANRNKKFSTAVGKSPQNLYVLTKSQRYRYLYHGRKYLSSWKTISSVLNRASRKRKFHYGC